MNVIFVGTLTDGFCIHSVVHDAETEDAVFALNANGQMTQVVELFNPFEHGMSVEQDFAGCFYVVFVMSIMSGIVVHGPFNDRVVSLEYAEETRDEGEQYEIVELESSDEGFEKGMWYVCSSYDGHVYSGPFGTEDEAQSEIDTDPDQAGGVTYQHNGKRG